VTTGRLVLRTFSVIFFIIAPLAVIAAPYAAMVIDARTGEVLHSRNADTRLHPASLTKMMTLYIAFDAIERGEISPDTMVTISRKAAAEPPSRLGLKAGQKIALRHLIRAAAVKSANDAATAIGEAIEGSEAAFARRMNRTALALGMDRTTFKNANGLTESGHLSTARDMTTLGRHLFYDFPAYYNLFSRIETDAGTKTVSNTNRRLLNGYRGADGIKTGYTRAAGYNLVASAERGGERIIATVFGGRSVTWRNERVAELLDMGFERAPTRVAVVKPVKPSLGGGDGGGAAETETRLAGLIERSPRPAMRPVAAPSEGVLVAMADGIADALAEAVAADAVEVTRDAPAPETIGAIALAALEMNAPAVRDTAALLPSGTPAAASLAGAIIRPAPRPLPEAESRAEAASAPVVVTRVTTSGGRHWAINVGRYTTRDEAERVLLQTALVEISTLDEALRKVVRSPQGWEANFVGLTEERAELACRRLQAQSVDCVPVGPGA
jgi:D-alanyl-D-alanine carboxypeptidase